MTIKGTEKVEGRAYPRRLTDVRRVYPINNMVVALQSDGTKHTLAV